MRDDGFFLVGATLCTCKRAAPGCLFMPQATVPQTSVSIIETLSLHLNPSCQPPPSLDFSGLLAEQLVFHLISIKLYLLFSVSTDSQLQMLFQRILARRLPQVAARHAIAPRASFSQIAALRAAEFDDPFQVRRLYGHYSSL